MSRDRRRRDARPRERSITPERGVSTRTSSSRGVPHDIISRAHAHRLMNAIHLARVTKRFGSHLAVDDLSLDVPAGSVYGFIGPNGSGKTTTLRMILHILLPDSGHIEVFGDPRTDIARDKIGYLPEERGLYKKMKVRRLLRYYGELKGKSRKFVDSEINRWTDQMSLGRLAGSAGRDALEGHGAEGPVHRRGHLATRPADPRRAVLRPRPGQRRRAARRDSHRPPRGHDHPVSARTT